MERVTAAILAAFERIWSSFLENEGLGFEPFLDRYKSDWVHSYVLFFTCIYADESHFPSCRNQTVTLITKTTVRIKGITSEGLLRTVPLSCAQGNQYIDLQPDDNSFDVIEGLVRVEGR